MPAIGSFANWPMEYDDCADQPAVHVYRASAHAGNDAGVGERSTFELGENQTPPRTLNVAEHAEDVDLEFLKLSALKHRVAGAGHAGLHLVQRHQRGLGRQDGPGAPLRRRPAPEDADRAEQSGGRIAVHEGILRSVIKAKSLLVKEKASRGRSPMDGHVTRAMLSVS